MATKQPTGKTLLLTQKNSPKRPQPETSIDGHTIEAWSQQVITTLVAGSNITLSPSDGSGPTVEITATGSGGSYYASLTGAGETTTPGALTQDGGLTITGTSSLGLTVDISTKGGPSAGVLIQDGSAVLFEAYSDSITGNQTIIIGSPTGNHVEVVEGNSITLAGDSATDIIISDGNIQFSVTSYISSTDFGYYKFADVDGNVYFQTAISSGYEPMIGFFGASPVLQPAAPTTLAQVITGLQNLGLFA
jgi:hypothetical protein